MAAPALAALHGRRSACLPRCHCSSRLQQGSLSPGLSESRSTIRSVSAPMLVGSEPVRLRPCTSMMATDCEMAAAQAEAVDSGAVAQHVMPYLQPPHAIEAPQQSGSECCWRKSCLTTGSSWRCCRPRVCTQTFRCSAAELRCLGLSGLQLCLLPVVRDIPILDPSSDCTVLPEPASALVCHCWGCIQDRMSCRFGLMLGWTWLAAVVDECLSDAGRPPPRGLPAPGRAQKVS